MPPPLVFINLDRDVHRLTRITAELACYPVQAQRLSACWWADLTPEQQTHWYSPELNADHYYKPLLNGEKGCYVSHIHAWQRLLDSDAKALVVLEDDVRLTTQFVDVVVAIAELDEPWDMVKLIGRNQEKIRSFKSLIPGTDLLDYLRVPSMTSGYVISRSGAKKLLAHRQPFGRPIDVDLRFWWECDDLRILGVSPSAITLDETSHASTVWHQVDKLTLRERWCKFAMKSTLTLGNAWHRRRLPKLASA